MKKIIPVIYICFSLLSTYAKESSSFKKIDSLEVLLKKSDELRHKNDMYQSLTYAFTSAKYAHKLKNDHYLSHAYFLIGIIQYEIIDYKNAKKHLLKAIEHSEKTEGKKLLPTILTSIGNVYYDDKQEYQNALMYYRKALKESKNNKHTSNNYGTLLCNFIRVSMDLNQFDRISAYIKEVDSIFKLPTSYEYNRSSYYLLKARNYVHNNDIENAKRYFEKSFELLKNETSWPKGKSYLYQYRAEMHEKNNDYTKALAARKKLQENEQKVFDYARSKNKKITKIRFKVDEYERKLKVDQREKQLLLNIDKNNKTIIYISIAGLILLFCIVFFYYREYNSKKRVSEILASKNTELSEAKHQAEKLSTIKSQFISTISHELRTPLYGVVGISSLLLENSKNSENDKTLLSSLKFSADYLLNLVNKVLNISKIDSKKPTLITTPTNLFALAKSIIQSYEQQSREKQNDLSLEYDHAIPNLIELDTLKISEILINLIGNAVKFTEKGKVWLLIKLISIDSKIVRIRFEVKDTGIGIPEDQKEHIFEEFTQIGSIYEDKQGTGLGLSIAKKLVQAMQSQIQFDSNKDIGSTFYFDIDVAISKPNDMTEKTITHTIEASDQLSAKILIAEDNKINQMITRKLVESIGCTGVIAENGLETIETLKKETFDVVLMDINMPVLDGKQAAIKIREFDQTTPIIALTASELSEVEEECLQAGMNALINKPLKKEDLRNCIKKQLIRIQSI